MVHVVGQEVVKHAAGCAYSLGELAIQLGNLTWCYSQCTIHCKEQRFEDVDEDHQLIAVSETETLMLAELLHEETGMAMLRRLYHAGCSKLQLFIRISATHQIHFCYNKRQAAIQQATMQPNGTQSSQYTSCHEHASKAASNFTQSSYGWQFQSCVVTSTKRTYRGQSSGSHEL